MLKPFLKEVLPSLAEQIRQKLIKEGKEELSKTVDDLQIHCLCECNDPNCGSFYLMEPPDENEDLPVEGYTLQQGELIEIIDGKIGFVEIMPSLYGSQVRERIKSVLIGD